MAHLDLADANELLAKAFEHAHTYNKAFSAAVVDSGGFILAVQREDGARPLTPQIAISKAYSAAVMQRPIKALNVWAEHEPTFFATLSQFGSWPIIASKGGVPIRRDGEFLGGIGVAGGVSDEDQDTAEAALQALGYELNYDEWAQRR
jgi:uncharacterized protein GlcG (DUF336 family)